MNLDAYLTAVNNKDKGKRHATSVDNHNAWDFLKDHSGNPHHSIVGEPSVRESRFKKGFYRRNASMMHPESERIRNEYGRKERYRMHDRRRCEFITRNSDRNGDIIGHKDSVKVKKVFKPTKKQHVVTQRELDDKNRNRQKIGAARYHVMLSKEERDLASRRRERNQLPHKATSSVLGFGRNDLPSMGVQDNFQGQGYKKLTRNRRIQRSTNIQPIAVHHRAPYAVWNDGKTNQQIQDQKRGSNTRARRSAPPFATDM